jgi:carboxylesterase
MAKRFAEAGFHVECPVLQGHGTRWEDIIGVKAEDWLQDLQGAMERLKARCSTVFVAGLSLGGALVLRLAQQDPSIRGVILVNHALVFSHPLVPFAFLLKYLSRSQPAIASDVKDPSVTEPAYARTPTAGVAEVHRLGKLVIADLPSFDRPLLVFKSREDHVLPIRNATLTMEKVASTDKELVWLENSYHVATMDFDKDIIAERSLDFVRRLSR